jgi:nucleoside-diphosphate-sugar epimerase
MGVLMKRRDFLKKTSAAVVAGAVIADRAASAADATAKSDQDARAQQGSSSPPGLLITSAEGALSQAIAEKLCNDWTVRRTGTSPSQKHGPFVHCDLGCDRLTDALVQGIDIIVHLAEPPPGTSGTAVIDHRTRRTYNLLCAAVKQGVRQVVYLSSLAIMCAYDEQLMVTEDFRPQPSSDPTSLSHYLGEFVCREFARSGQFDVVVLRLGALGDPQPDTLPEGGIPSVESRDVASAVSLAIGYGRSDDRPLRRNWTVLHIHSEPASDRFPIANARRLLRYKPELAG